MTLTSTPLHKRNIRPANYRLTPVSSLPQSLQSELTLLRNIVNQTLTDYSSETPLSDKLAIANIIHFSVAAYNRMVSALYYPSHPPIQHLYDWAAIREKMDGAIDQKYIYAEPEPIFPLEPYTQPGKSDEFDPQILF
ncbi:MAG: hypothetical protein ACYDH1_12655 [Anaerolineaceae bacterium]